MKANQINSATYIHSYLQTLLKITFPQGSVDTVPSHQNHSIPNTHSKLMK